MGAELGDVWGTVERAEAQGSSDPEGALAALSAVVGSHTRRTAPEVAARASYLRARFLCDIGQYDEALAAIRLARSVWLSAGQEMEALRTDLGRASVLIELGEYREAIAISDSLLATLEGHASFDHAVSRQSLRAGAHGNRGNALNLLGEHLAAIRSYDVATNLYAALGERPKQVEMDANRAIAYLRMGMVHRAVIDLERAHGDLEALGLARAAAKCRVDLAEAMLLLGRPRTALRHLQSAQSALESLRARPEMARALLLGARCLLRTGIAKAAHHQAGRALDAFQELNMLSESADAAHVAGAASAELGLVDQATAEFKSAERLYGASNEEASQAVVWLARARLATPGSLQRPRLAEAALERLERVGSSAQVAAGHLEMTRLVTDPAAAARHLDAATELIQNLDLVGLRLEREGAAARLARRVVDLPRAVATLREALREDRARAREGRDLHHHGSGHLVRELSDELISLLVALDTPSARAEAWQVATLSRSAALDALLSRMRRDHTDAPAVADAQLSALYDELRVGDRADHDEVQRRIRDLECDLLCRFLAASGTEQDTPGTDLPEIPEIPVLQFHVIDDDVIAFVLRDGGVETRLLPGAGAECLTLTEEWRIECSRMQSHSGSPQTRELVAAELMRAFHAALVAPVEDLLADLDGQPLLVVAHRFLGEVPFEAIDCGGHPMSERYHLYFGVGWPTSAVSGGHAYDETVAIGEDGVLLMAVPDEVAPRIDDEAEQVAAVWPGAQVFTGDTATRAELRKRGPDAWLVHLACHGVHREENPLFSGLRLADGWVTGVDALMMDLRGATFVLSSCDVGRASNDDPEPTGLPWALLAAGCDAVVGAMWAADDEVTTLFMTELHAGLRGGAGIREAVDAARVLVAAHHPHPYHWAAFRYLCSPHIALLEGNAR